MKYLALFTICLAFLACNNHKSPDKYIESIKKLEANASLAQSDTLINSYIQFSKQFPDHKLAPLFMFKAAQSYIKSNQVLKGVRLYEAMATQYKNDSLAPEATICAAVGLESLNDPANAKRLFDQFVKNYPDHPRANEVKSMSEAVGLSDEELLKRFSQKNLSDSATAK